jgi:hypothetical protein
VFKKSPITNSRYYKAQCPNINLDSPSFFDPEIGSRYLTPGAKSNCGSKVEEKKMAKSVTETIGTRIGEHVDLGRFREHGAI